MASRGTRQAREEERRQRDISRLSRLFKGRISEAVAEELLSEQGSLPAVVQFLLGDQEAVRRRLDESEAYVYELQEDSDKFQALLDGDVEDRQFACADCSKSWWKRVPITKEVARCYGCRRKFDPIPREHEWGKGRFYCQCGNTFIGFAIMNRTESRCLVRDCLRKIPVWEILPPKKTHQGQYRPKPLTHNCNGINCYRSAVFDNPCNSGRFNGSRDNRKPPVCIHPSSGDPDERTTIHWASELHVSTGSTIPTFLDQGSLVCDTLSVALTLETIAERLEDFDDENDDGNQ